MARLLLQSLCTRKHLPQDLIFLHCKRSQNHLKFFWTTISTIRAIIRSIKRAKVAGIAGQGYWPVTTIQRLQGSAALQLLGRHSETRSHRCSKSVHFKFPAGHLRYLSLRGATPQAKTSDTWLGAHYWSSSLKSIMSQQVLRWLVAAALSATSATQSWPNRPFVTEGSSIRDASGNQVTYAGVNVGQSPASTTGSRKRP